MEYTEYYEIHYVMHTGDSGMYGPFGSFEAAQEEMVALRLDDDVRQAVLFRQSSVRIASFSQARK